MATDERKGNHACSRVRRSPWRAAPAEALRAAGQAGLQEMWHNFSKCERLGKAVKLSLHGGEWPQNVMTTLNKERVKPGCQELEVAQIQPVFQVLGLQLSHQHLPPGGGTAPSPLSVPLWPVLPALRGRAAGRVQHWVRAKTDLWGRGCYKCKYWCMVYVCMQSKALAQEQSQKTLCNPLWPPPRAGGLGGCWHKASSPSQGGSSFCKSPMREQGLLFLQLGCSPKPSWWSWAGNHHGGAGTRLPSSPLGIHEQAGHRDAHCRTNTPIAE